MIIGLVFGALAYRSAYAAVFDFRYNHIPLPPFGAKTQFLYTIDPPQLATGSLRERSAEDDHLVVWNWWKFSRFKDEERDRRLSWLRGIRGTGISGAEVSPKIKLESVNASTRRNAA